MSSNGSSSTTSSQRSAALAIQHGNVAHLSEKQKMILGVPFHAYRDNELLKDRRDCKEALNKYNETDKHPYSVEEHAKLFQPIVDPTRRLYYQPPPDGIYNGPKGHVGTDTLVETPFKCDYGYNLHLGNDVLIQSGCYLSDASEIYIGNRTIVGPNVKFYCTTASIDATLRQGTKGQSVAGAVKVGEDCFIGGDTIIMPFRKIGKGAVVGAGSVVTKVCLERVLVWTW